MCVLAVQRPVRSHEHPPPPPPAMYGLRRLLTCGVSVSISIHHWGTLSGRTLHWPQMILTNNLCRGITWHSAMNDRCPWGIQWTQMTAEHGDPGVASLLAVANGFLGESYYLRNALDVEHFFSVPTSPLEWAPDMWFRTQCTSELLITTVGTYMIWFCAWIGAPISIYRGYIYPRYKSSETLRERISVNMSVCTQPVHLYLPWT